MPEMIRGRPTLMRCVFEGAIRNFKLGANGELACFKLEHDGSKPNEENVQADNPRFFTREYRLWVDGKPTPTKIDFKYDYRTGKADFSVAYQHLKQLKQVMNGIEAIKEGDKDNVAVQKESTEGHNEAPKAD